MTGALNNPHRRVSCVRLCVSMPVSAQKNQDKSREAGITGPPLIFQVLTSPYLEFF